MANDKWVWLAATKRERLTFAAQHSLSSLFRQHTFVYRKLNNNALMVLFFTFSLFLLVQSRVNDGAID